MCIAAVVPVEAENVIVLAEHKGEYTSTEAKEVISTGTCQVFHHN